jgi:hypothetical protein
MPGPEANELGLDGKPGANDPTKFRQGTFDPGVSFGCFSGDLLSGDPEKPRRDERVLVQLKPDDTTEEARAAIAAGKPGGMFEVYITRPGGDSDDDQICILRVNSAGVEIHGQPTTPPVTNPAGAPRVYHEGGQYVTIYQNDGNIVTYFTNGSADESTWVATWSSFGGKA